MNVKSRVIWQRIDSGRHSIPAILTSKRVQAAQATSKGLKGEVPTPLAGYGSTRARLPLLRRMGKYGPDKACVIVIGWFGTRGFAATEDRFEVN